MPSYLFPAITVFVLRSNSPEIRIAYWRFAVNWSTCLAGVVYAMDLNRCRGESKRGGRKKKRKKKNLRRNWIVKKTNGRFLSVRETCQSVTCFVPPPFRTLPRYKRYLESYLLVEPKIRGNWSSFSTKVRLGCGKYIVLLSLFISLLLGNLSLRSSCRFSRKIFCPPLNSATLFGYSLNLSLSTWQVLKTKGFRRYYNIMGFNYDHK